MSQHHTPGPWRYVQRPNGLVHIVTADLDTTVAIIPVSRDTTNAHLLAAAPDLLAALEMCVYWLDQLPKAPKVPISCSVNQIGHSALRAARGLEDS